jgi:hypothetical protein
MAISYIRIPAGLLLLKIRSAYELITLALIVGFGNKGLHLSHGKLARTLQIDRRSAVRVIQRLQAAGRVEVERRDGRRIVRASDDILSLLTDDNVSTANGDGLSTEVVTDGSLAPVTGESPPSKLNIRTPALKEKHTRRKAPTFTPPTVEQVREFAGEKGHPGFDAQRFIEYYAAADWHDSKGNPVRNWKQKLLAIWLPGGNGDGKPADAGFAPFGTHRATRAEIEALEAEGVL